MISNYCKLIRAKSGCCALAPADCISFNHYLHNYSTSVLDRSSIACERLHIGFSDEVARTAVVGLLNRELTHAQRITSSLHDISVVYVVVALSVVMALLMSLGYLDNTLLVTCSHMETLPPNDCLP